MTGFDHLIAKSLKTIKSKKSNGEWYTITDLYVNAIVLQAFGDPEKKKILESVTDTPKIIADILNDCHLRQTTGYRMINSMINDGLLVKSGQVVKDNKKISKYVCIFDNLKINIEKDNMRIDVQLTQH